VPDLDQLEQQVSYLTEALKRLRQGKFDGADGIDGAIVALQGGQPLDFQPTWPEAEPGTQNPEPKTQNPALVPNGAYFRDPNFEADLDRYSARVSQLLGPAIASFARAQARLETGNGQLFSTPFNFGNIGNTDDNPNGGGGFPNPEAAADAWVAFITNNGGPTRYQAFLDAGSSGRGTAGASVATLAGLIEAAGYATDPDYAQKIAALA